MSRRTSTVHPDRSGHARRTMWGYHTEDHPTLDRVQNSVSAFCGVIAGAAVVSITLLTLAEVFARTAFSSPLGWSVSFIELYLLPVTAFFGLVAAYRSGAHVAVVSLFEKLGPRAQKLMLVLSYVVLIIGLLSIGIPGVHAVLAAVANGEGPGPGSSELVIPSAVWRAIVPISALFGLILVGIDLFREATAPLNRVVTDYDPGDEIELDDEDLADLGQLADEEPKNEPCVRTETTK
jgi:TRAP-type C4-dicarboxylate transport system permease small subunit